MSSSPSQESLQIDSDKRGPLVGLVGDPSRWPARDATWARAWGERFGLASALARQERLARLQSFRSWAARKSTTS
eukprot:scaffold8679_cov98-Phaeocystis_antarctica.AAC.1